MQNHREGHPHAELAREQPNVHFIRRYSAPVPPEPDFRLNLFDARRASRQEQPGRDSTERRAAPCTDGLTDLVWNDGSSRACHESEPEGGKRAVVNLANERGVTKTSPSC